MGRRHRSAPQPKRDPWVSHVTRSTSAPGCIATLTICDLGGATPSPAWGRPETPDRCLTGTGVRGLPRQHERLAVRFPEGADQLPAAVCPPGEDPAQERRRRILFCGQPDELVVVALGGRFGTHGGYRPFPFAGAGGFPILVLAPMVSTVAGCWGCGFTFRAAPWPRGVRGST